MGVTEGRTGRGEEGAEEEGREEAAKERIKKGNLWRGWKEEEEESGGKERKVKRDTEELPGVAEEMAGRNGRRSECLSPHTSGIFVKELPTRGRWEAYGPGGMGIRV